ncbi:MAG: glycosyltransferase family 2 protein [Bacillota bacterium]|nr:glycosyltransferase family 2 protein [Bacillota bacterium]
MYVALIVIFVLSVFLSVYTYVFYPAILFALRKKYPKHTLNTEYFPKVSVIIAAYNEEKVIREKAENLLSLNYPIEKMEFLFGSDGSTDKTVAILNEYKNIPSFKIFDYKRGGKVNVLNNLMKEASGEIFIFTDANTMLHPDAVKILVQSFKDNIGCVSGQLRLMPTGKNDTGEQSEGSYWKYENIIKKYESKIGKLSGANGALYAVKRELCSELPSNIINDDFYISTMVTMSGKDVIMNADAIAYETPNDSLKSQFDRHIRDGAGHYQLIPKFLPLLSPLKGAASFTYVSHRLIRWLVPFFIILAIVSSFILAFNSVAFAVIFALQALCYLFMVLYSFLQSKNIKIPLVSMVFYFLCVNLALLLGLFRLCTKKQKQTWETQR